ncbi:MAG: RDD family protein [Alphaproteobacteria bacterium]|nr:RDD family protein [Alphaproteobacteria bacterium]
MSPPSWSNAAIANAISARFGAEISSASGATSSAWRRRRSALASKRRGTSVDQASTPTTSSIHAGFWRRIAALLVDLLVVGAYGMVIGFTFFDLFSAWTWEGNFLGIALAFPYFAIMNSRVGGGSTVGKRFLKLQVVGRDHLPVSLQRSSARSLLLVIPFILNGIEARADESFGFVGLALFSVAIFVIFGGMITIAYLYLFNRRNRRSLHDMLAGTMVVDRRSSGPASEWNIWKPHLAIASAILLVGLIFLGLAIARIDGTAAVSLFDSYQSALRIPGVMTATVEKGQTVVSTVRTGISSTRFVAVNARLYHDPDDIDQITSDLANVIFERPEILDDVDVLVINVRWGFDIGIASWMFSERRQFTPDAWPMPPEVKQPPTNQDI